MGNSESQSSTLITIVFKSGYIIGTFPNERSAINYIESSDVKHLTYKSYSLNDFIKLEMQNHKLRSFIEEYKDYGDSQFQKNAKHTLDKVNQIDNIAHLSPYVFIENGGV